MLLCLYSLYASLSTLPAFFLALQPPHSTTSILWIRPTCSHAIPSQFHSQCTAWSSLRPWNTESDISSPVGLVERRALSSDSANVVPSWKLHLKKILLVLFPQGVWTPNPVIIVKATRLRSEGVERFLPRRRIDVVIRDLSVLHTDWITAAREVWNKMRIGTYDIQKNALYTI